MYGSLPPPPFQCWLWERTESDHLKTWVSRLGIFPFSSLRSADNEELSSKSLWVRPFLFLGHAQTPRLASQLWKVLSTVWQAAQYLSSLQRNADCKISLLIHIKEFGGHTDRLASGATAYAWQLKGAFVWYHRWDIPSRVEMKLGKVLLILLLFKALPVQHNGLLSLVPCEIHYMYHHAPQRDDTKH